ncbi:hypothetical protein D3Z36_05100 [Lachnospiraceae bacterium]|nr:hypothetical protein [Lachnospiraceae bacterium]
MKNRSLRFSVFLMIGIICSGIVTVMYLTGSVNLDCFYDVGKLYNVSGLLYADSDGGWLYDYEKDRVVMQKEHASYRFDIESRQKKWNYLYLEVEDLSEETAASIEFLGRKDEPLYVLEFELQDGRSVMQLEEEDIYAVNIIISKQVSFSMKKIQFREKMQNFEWSQAPGIFVVALACYFLIVLLVLYLLRHYRRLYGLPKSHTWTGMLQKLYACFLEHGQKPFRRLSTRGRSLSRRLLFMTSILLVYFALIRKWNLNILAQRRMVLSFAICLLLIAAISWERTEKTVNWQNPLAAAWMATWLMSVVSEFVVEKNVQNLGIFMLGAMGPLYMAWGSMKRPEYMIRDFLTALRWSYWTACFFCLFFRSLIPGIRYSGIYKNPNLFAGFLVTVNIAFLIYLDENLNRERLRKGLIIKNAFGLATIWGFLQLTESVTSLAVYIMEWGVFLWKQFPTEKKKVYQKNIRKMLTVFGVSIFIVGFLGKWALNNVPHMLGTEFFFQEEEVQTATGMVSLSLTAEAAGKSGISDRLLRKVTSGEWYGFFSGRDEIWKEYIRNWNLLGHADYQECGSAGKTHAHNAILQTMHYYGIFIVVPYLIMLYYSLKYGIMAIFSRNQMRMNLFFLLSAANYIVQGFAEDVATPYLYISWLTYYIALGGMFHQLEKTET